MKKYQTALVAVALVVVPTLVWKVSSSRPAKAAPSGVPVAAQTQAQAMARAQAQIQQAKMVQALRSQEYSYLKSELGATPAELKSYDELRKATATKMTERLQKFQRDEMHNGSQEIDAAARKLFGEKRYAKLVAFRKQMIEKTQAAAAKAREKAPAKAKPPKQAAGTAPGPVAPAKR